MEQFGCVVHISCKKGIYLTVRNDKSKSVFSLVTCAKKIANLSFLNEKYFF